MLRFGDLLADLWHTRGCLTWLPHMRLLIILHRFMALFVRPAQPRLRQISNRQRIRRPALCVTYTMSDAMASPSSFSCEM